MIQIAKYHKRLTYHNDEISKHKITQEEIDFLKGLQEELNTQDHIGQVDPRFWVIKGTEKLYHVEEADGYELYDSERCEVLVDSTKGICEYINEELLEEINSNRLDGEAFTVEFEEGVLGERIIVSWLDGGCEEDAMSEELCDLHDIHGWLEEQGYGNLNVISYKMVDKIYENTMFLSQKDAEDHLKSNDYHYSDDAHTYAMTAWRSPRVEKLMKILQETEW